MSDAASNRRWSGYVCPECRMVFRIPQNYDGRGVVCPGCRRMLRVPQDGDAVPALTTDATHQRRSGRSPI